MRVSRVHSASARKERVAARRSLANADIDVKSLLRRSKARRNPKTAKQIPQITDSILAIARQRRTASLAPGSAANPFNHFPKVPDGVIPGGKPQVAKLAMDSQQDLTFPQVWAAAAFQSGAVAYGSAWDEGLAFPGYAFLAALTQRPEYRRLSEIIATEMTRKWIKVHSIGDEEDDQKLEKIRQLNDELDRLRVRDHFRTVCEQDGFFGRSHLYLDTGSTDDREELMTPIGDGRSEASRNKFAGQKNFLKALIPVEAVWTYPTTYNSNDPLKPAWYNPSMWYVMGKQVHSSRLLKFVGREVPDLLKPAYSFGGLSLSQMLKPYVDNWLRTRQSVADIVSAFSIFVLETDLSESLSLDGQQLFARMELFNLCRDNKGLMALNKETEGFQNVSAPLGGLDSLQTSTQEHLCSVSGIPIVKYLGIQPNGMNASSEGELRAFYDWIGAFQEKFFRQNLTTVIDFVQLSIWGEVDQDLTFSFEPLFSLNEKEQAEVNKIESETDEKYAEAGIVSQEEVREKIASRPQSGYNNLDTSDVPDLLEEEEEGLEPHAGAVHLAEGEEDKGEEKKGEDDEPGGGLKKDFLKGQNPLNKDHLKGKNPLNKDHLKGQNPLDKDHLKNRVKDEVE